MAVELPEYSFLPQVVCVRKPERTGRQSRQTLAGCWRRPEQTSPKRARLAISLAGVRRILLSSRM